MLGPFRLQKRLWCFVIGAEKTLSCTEKVRWNNEESELSIVSSATRTRATREASKCQSQRSFLFLQCVIWMRNFCLQEAVEASWLIRFKKWANIFKTATVWKR